MDNGGLPLEEFAVQRDYVACIEHKRRRRELGLYNTPANTRLPDRDIVKVRLAGVIQTCIFNTSAQD